CLYEVRQAVAVHVLKHDSEGRDRKDRQCVRAAVRREGSGAVAVLEDRSVVEQRGSGSVSLVRQNDVRETVAVDVCGEGSAIESKQGLGERREILLEGVLVHQRRVAAGISGIRERPCRELCPLRLSG